MLLFGGCHRVGRLAWILSPEQAVSQPMHATGPLRNAAAAVFLPEVPHQYNELLSTALCRGEIHELAILRGDDGLHVFDDLQGSGNSLFFVREAPSRFQFALVAIA